jgi:ketosteroid isomerase-like protein
MPGLVAAKDFAAEDGERLALIEFDSAERLAAWRGHAEHAAAQARGRARYYAAYAIDVCAPLRRARFDAASGRVERRGADPADHRALAERWIDCFARADLEALLALYAEDAVHTSPKIRGMHPESGGVLRGKPALREWWRGAFARLPGLRYELTALTADGERVFMEYVRKAPGEADLPVAEVLEIGGDGRIVASRVFHG